MATREEAKAAIEQRLGLYKVKTPVRTVFLGDGRGLAASNMYVPGQPQYVYARESIGDPSYFAILNKTVTPRFNQPVIAGVMDHDPEIEQILDIDHDADTLIAGGGGGSQLSQGPHGNQHQFGGGDEVYIDSRLFLPGLVYPTVPPSTSLQVSAFSYYYKQWDRFSSKTTGGFDKYIPTGASIRYVMLALDPESRDLVMRPGELFSSSDAAFAELATGGEEGGWGFVPAPAGDEYPLGAIRLDASTTSLDWFAAGGSDNVIETRLHITTPYRKVLDRLSGVEGLLGIGQEQTLATTGVTQSKVDQFKANAAQLQDVSISTVSPTNNQALVYISSSGGWAPSTIAGLGGEANTGTNLGTGLAVFKTKQGVDFEYKTLIAGTNVTMASNASAVTINSTGGGAGEANTIVNLGTGFPIFREKSGVNLNIRSLSAGTNVDVASSTSLITISSVDTKASAQSLGTGLAVFKETAGNIHQFKSLSPGANMNSASNASVITLTGINTTNSATNLGTGVYGLFKQTAGGQHQLKTILAGANITLGSAASTVTISGAAGAGEANTGSNLGAGSEMFREKSGTSLLFRTISQGSNVVINENTSTIEIAPIERHHTETIAGRWLLDSTDFLMLETGNRNITFPSALSYPAWQGPRTYSAQINQIDVGISGGSAASAAINFERRAINSLNDVGTTLNDASQIVQSGSSLQINSFDRNLVLPEYWLVLSASGITQEHARFLTTTIYYDISTALNGALKLETNGTLLQETGNFVLLEN